MKIKFFSYYPPCILVLNGKTILRSGLRELEVPENTELEDVEWHQVESNELDVTGLRKEEQILNQWLQ